MQNYLKKYLAGCLLFFLLIIIAGSFNSFLYNKSRVNLTASMLMTIFNPASLPADAKPASGYAWNDNVGWINFGEDSSDPTGRVYVSNNKLYGYAWGENIGWISLTCSNDTSANCSGGYNYGVTQNNRNGTLTGYAWGENIGWIDFAPTGGGVHINPLTGDFTGYAWGENIGWISFNCANDNSCGTSNYKVSTAWMNYMFNYAAGSNGYLSGSSSQMILSGNDGSTVTAKANDSYHFLKWSDGVTTDSRTDTAASSSISVTASFEPDGIIVRNTCVYTYSDWSPCINERQYRTATANVDNCANSADQPLSQTCTAQATTTDETATTTATTTPTISLTPAFISLHKNATSTFSVVLTETNSDIVWSIKEGSKAGRISALNDSTGLFIAGTATGTYHIIAKLKDYPDISASSTVSISEESVFLPVSITIDPKIMEMYVNDSILFKSFINNTDNKDTTWKVAEEGGGTIDDNGVYTAPNMVGTFHVQAIPKADISKVDMAAITVRLKPLIATSTATTTDSASTTTTVNNNGETVDNNGNVVTSNNTGGGNSNVSGSGGTINNPAVRTPGSGNNLVDNIASVLNVSQLVTDNVAVLGTTTQKIVLEVKKVAESPVGSAVTNTITTVGVVGGGVAASSVFALNGTAVADILFLPFKLWGLLLSALGLRRRNRPWGTVYDSVTKQPIDPAYVTLTNLKTKEENTSITDLDGRYGFLVAPGKYALTANKTNYIFPSKKMSGKTEDILYGNLYLGGEINVQITGAVISKNIPLDPIKFDWNEFVKGEKKMMKFYSKREKLMRVITDWIFRLGFVISVVSLLLVNAPYNYIIFILYIVLALLRKFGLRQKTSGSLTEKDGTPLSFAIIRVFDSELKVEITNKVADKIGRYYCLVNKGKYYVRVEKKNDDESYTEIMTSPVFEAPNGIINRNFTV